ncbi:beta-1,6-N-acetylglucosaminyltransferase [Streptococcus dentapri]|uniref:Peptide O-xylosyltransferase n=1 Tax=Streptococcus dentapri TaxID=573564 RepID=A0ABV8D181_9STRE
MTKHAYLVIAHSHFDQLAFLVSLLDNADNDIFIHIDAKASFSQADEQELRTACQQSNLIITERQAIYWGGFSQVKAELLLFKAAHNYGHYDFYHLLSGVDLPLASQAEIHHFFDEHKGEIFMSRMTLDGDPENINRQKYYHFFQKFTPRTLPGIIGKALFKIYRLSEISIQKLMRVNLLKKHDLTPMKASNWVSLPEDVVITLLEEEDWIVRTFGKTFLSDEVFLPIFLDKFGFNDRVFDNTINHNEGKEFQGNLRFVNWWDGNPYVWTDSDEDKRKLEKIKQEGYLFTRKFDLATYPKCQNIIKEVIKK